jgi:KaiC domain protein
VAGVSEGEDEGDDTREDWFEAALGDDADGSPDVEWDEVADDVDWDDEKWDDDSTADELGTDEGAFDDTDAPGAGTDGEAESSDDGDGDGVFEEGFAAAMNEAPPVEDPPSGDGGEFDMGGGGEFDMGDGGGEFGMGGPAEFDEDEFESDIPRIDLGIDGLDEMIQGGVPDRSLMVTIGSAGTGKTTFGLQFLSQALCNDERAIYITLEESRERVVNSATEKGIPFDEYANAGQLAVVDIDPVEMANSLTSIRSELPRLIEEFGASRLVLDSVSLLEMMYDDRAKRRNEIYDFTRSLKNAGVTTMLTSEASEDTPYASRHGIVEYLTDAVFILQYVRPSDFRETRLAIEIQKIRDANHSRETKPYEITDEGLSVFQGANIF